MTLTSEKLKQLEKAQEQNTARISGILKKPVGNRGAEVDEAIAEGEKILLDIYTERIALLQKSINEYPTKGLKRDLKLYQALKQRAEKEIKERSNV